MKVQAKESSTMLELNPIIVSFIKFKDNFSKLKNNNLERKMSPTINSRKAHVGESLFGYIS